MRVHKERHNTDAVFEIRQNLTGIVSNSKKNAPN